MKKIGIVLIATNAYFVLGIKFMKRFVYYYKGNADITFHFFSNRDPKEYLPNHIKYVWYFADNKTWQDGTNMKFTSILSIAPNCDDEYLFYFDADTSVDRDFTEEWFLGEFVGGQHYNDPHLTTNAQRDFERNPKYAGYIPLDSPYKQMYYYGAFFGGINEKIINFCTALVDMQQHDTALSHEPTHNDETYINKFFHYYPPSKIILSHDFKFSISHKGGLEVGYMDLDVEYYLRILRDNINNVIDIANKEIIVQGAYE